MTKILHIEASPRGAESKSNEIARAHVEALRQRNGGSQVDTLDLWREPLPEFDGNSAAAKLTFFGVGELSGAKKTAWDRIVEITERFKAADHYVIGAPIWTAAFPIGSSSISTSSRNPVCCSGSIRPRVISAC